MKKKFFSSLALMVFGLSLSSTAYARPKPNLYPNKKLKTVSQVQSDRDVIECQIKAEDYESSTGGGKNSGSRDVARGAARGAALGALAGTIKKDNAGRSAGAGAAVGGLAAVLDRRRKQKELQQNGSPQY